RHARRLAAERRIHREVAHPGSADRGAALGARIGRDSRRAARCGLRVSRRWAGVSPGRPRAAAAPRLRADGVGCFRAGPCARAARVHGSAAAPPTRDRCAARGRARGARAVTATVLLPWLVLLSSLVPGMIIFFLPEEWR